MNLFQLELTSATQIAAPRAAVWSVFADVALWPEWCKVCVHCDVEPDFDWSPGQRINIKFCMAGLGVPFNVGITEIEQGSSVAWASTKLTVTAVRTFTFTENSPGVTTVTDHKLFTSPLFPLRLFYPRPIIRNMTESMLADLKTECEKAGQG